MSEMNSIVIFKKSQLILESGLGLCALEPQNGKVLQIERGDGRLSEVTLNDTEKVATSMSPTFWVPIIN